MKALVIGAGNMGSAFVQQLNAAGHTVRVTARQADKAQALASQHAGVTAVAAPGAAEGVDVVIVATAYPDAVDALHSVGVRAGQVVVDISNPLTADYMGLTIGHSSSAAEQIAAALPGVHVVKAFNTLFAPVLAAGADLGAGRKATVFVAADDAAAKTRVLGLAESLGFATQDTGPLKNARYLEPLAGLNIYFGYGAGLGTQIVPAWLHKA